MAIPDFQSLMLPLLQTLQDGNERSMRDVTDALADRFKLTQDERQELMANGVNRVFYNRVAWARTHL